MTDVFPEVTKLVGESMNIIVLLLDNGSELSDLVAE
jgi:hypothetical protein